MLEDVVKTVRGASAMYGARLKSMKAPQPPGGLEHCTACGASCNRYGPALYMLEEVAKTARGQIYGRLELSAGLD